MEAIVAKLSGFAKFEVKTKISAKNFETIIQTFQQPARDGEECIDETDKFLSIFERIGEQPFQGDLDNEDYKRILQTFREIKFE